MTSTVTLIRIDVGESNFTHFSPSIPWKTVNKNLSRYKKSKNKNQNIQTLNEFSYVNFLSNAIVLPVSWANKQVTEKHIIICGLNVSITFFKSQTCQGNNRKIVHSLQAQQDNVDIPIVITHFHVDFSAEWHLRELQIIILLLIIFMHARTVQPARDVRGQ
jgi:hypothetical protein